MKKIFTVILLLVLIGVICACRFRSNPKYYNPVVDERYRMEFQKDISDVGHIFSGGEKDLIWCLLGDDEIAIIDSDGQMFDDYHFESPVVAVYSGDCYRLVVALLDGEVDTIKVVDEVCTQTSSTFTEGIIKEVSYNRYGGDPNIFVLNNKSQLYALSENGECEFLFDDVSHVFYNEIFFEDGRVYNIHAKEYYPQIVSDVTCLKVNRSNTMATTSDNVYIFNDFTLEVSEYEYADATEVYCGLWCELIYKDGKYIYYGDIDTTTFLKEVPTVRYEVIRGLPEGYSYFPDDYNLIAYKENELIIYKVVPG